MRSGRIAAVATAVVALSTVAAGGVLAGSNSSDETALRPTRSAPDRGIEAKVNSLVGKMTLDEKLQQIQLLSDGQITDADARAGVGGVFSLVDPDKINHYQHIAVSAPASIAALNGGRYRFRSRCSDMSVVL